ncbi:MAG: lipid-A-disaccharide synthase, partial [Prevotellaceae bacterium]|nr:lipid-A-disaccharide synthase [Prevotellaceae bacterium]
TYSLLHQSFAAVVNSGTATLETALIGTPQVVVYHVFGGRVASLLRKWLIRVPYVSLVNLVAERCLVTELITHHFTAQNLQKALQLLLYDTAYRDAMLQGYGDIRQKLGTPHAAIRTAREIYKSVSQNE